MSADAWLTLVVIGVTVAVLASERVSAPLTVLGSVAFLLVSGVVDASAAFSGFSSEAPVTIAALYVMAGAAEATGALDRVVGLALGARAASPRQRRAGRGELIRLLPPAALLSTVVYNTPTVGLLAPQVSAWASRSRRSPSWYLLALNFAVLVGGLVTAIGTTTNVVVSGLLVNAHLPPLGLFEIAPVGVPIALIGLVLIVALAPWLVPGRSGPNEGAGGDMRDFTLEMVLTGGRLAGQTVTEAGLRHLEGVYLVEVTRQDRTIAPVAPEEVLVTGDRLTFAGNVSRILDLQRMPGLVSAAERHFSVTGDGPGRQFFEVVVGAGSSLAGATLKEADFRGRYAAAVLAIHRAGERLPGKLGEVRLRPGDVLLALAAAGFDRRWTGSQEFLIVAPFGQRRRPPQRDKAWLVAVVLVGFLVATASGLVSVLDASLVAAFALVALRVLSPTEAGQAINLNVIVVLAGSFGLGAAASQSGLAGQLADLLVRAFSGFGDVGVLAGVLLATAVLTQVVTNNATAVVMFPIALSAAAAIHADPRAFAIAVAVGASSSFLTPIGYQTNMIVYGMGGYRFADFLPLGTVLLIATTLTALVMVPIAFPLH